MTRITIDIDAMGGGTQMSTSQTGTGAQGQSPAQADTSEVPADILAKAAATGAFNAGQAPSLVGSTSRPQPFITSQSQPSAASDSTSAGAAPYK